MTNANELDVPVGVSLKKLLEAPRRRPWHIVVPCLALAMLGFGVSFLATTMYRTSTMILLEADKVPETIVGTRGRERDAKPRMLTIRQEILARSRIETILKELNPYPGKMGRVSLSAIVETLRGATEISPKGTEAFTIEFVHSDAQKAMLVANRLASLFIEEAVKSREAVVEGAADFLEQQLADARKALEEKDREVRLYKERYLGRLPDQTQANLATLSRLQMDRQSIEASLVAARERELTMQRAVAEGMITTREGAVVPANDPSAELAKARQDLAALRTRYTDEHPDVRALVARVERIERDAAAGRGVAPAAPAGSSALQAQLDQARGEIQSLTARKANVESQMAVFQGRVESAPQAEQELKVLTRDLERLNANYDQLLAKKLDAQMTERTEKRWRGERFRVLDPAYAPESPYYPNRMLFTLAGAVFGLLIGLGLAFGTELLDPSIKTQGELEDILAHPVLVTFPTIPDVIPHGPDRVPLGAKGGGAAILEIDDWRGRDQASR